MNEHKWYEKAFTDGGTYHGYQTCLNTWGCKNCGLEIELPLGVNPRQYQHVECKGGENVQRTSATDLHMRRDSGLLQGNRHDKRSFKVREMQS